jgi:cephalosporin-C deacetylase-like acetyl esterase
LPNTNGDNLDFGVASPKYAKFDLFEVTYKVFNDQNIQAFALIPKNIPSRKYPVMVKFHGGFFVRLPEY